MNGPAHHSPRSLSARLADLAADHPTGTLRCDDFMAAALYDPDDGYYTRAEAIGGPRRDFSTIPSLSALLGRAVARWVLSLPGAGRGPVDIIEVGAGGGHLAAAVLESAGWWARRRVRYHIVEISPRLRRAQEEMLAGRKITWHATVAEATASSNRPIVISNELVDAFPCRLLRFENGSWRELRLAWPPAADEPLRSSSLEDPHLDDFSATGPDHWPDRKIPEGQIIEVQPLYLTWLKEWAPSAQGLDHLTIDYGDVMPGLYWGRLKGTLRGYFSHQRLTGGSVFRAPGKVDLTCDVNFTDLENWGKRCGLRTVELTDQAGFLENRLPARMKAECGPELAAITNPEGAGGAFRVLWQTAR